MLWVLILAACALVALGAALGGTYVGARVRAELDRAATDLREARADLAVASARERHAGAKLRTLIQRRLAEHAGPHEGRDG